MVTHRSRAVRYPWKKWLKGKRFTLVRGKDYHCQPHAMASQVRNAATRNGYWVSLSIQEEVITVSATPK